MNYDEQIDCSFDGQLSQDEWDALQKAILADDKLRQCYVEKRWLHAQLLANEESLHSLLEDSNSSARADSSVSGRPFLWLNAAAVLLLLGLVVSVLFQRGEEMVATIIEAEGCRWEGSDLPTREGAKLGTGTLALAEGMATIRFESGATVTMEAPTTLEVLSAMQCQLVEGSVVADVPESAHGFVIDTEKMKVVDLGTRFGLTANALGGSHVFVFEGEVEVQRDDEEEVQRLLTGKSMHHGADSPAPDAEVVRATAQPAPRPGNWTAISTATGRGRDTFLRNGEGHAPAGGDPMLMVKQTDLVPGNQRRALLTFDLAAAEAGAIGAAILTLKVENSGLGFAALVPDSKFAVYGVLDVAIDDWREDELSWKTAASHLTAETLDASRYVRLAEFEINKGSSHGLIEVSSDELAEFLSQRAGGLANIVLIRETGELDRQGLVHAFASKEHPSGPAPTLWLKEASRNAQ
jgi:hypothetical protein